MIDKTDEEFKQQSDPETAHLTAQADARMDNDQRRRVADVLGRDVDEIAADLDDIEACIRLYGVNKAENAAMPTAVRRAAELRKFQALLSNILSRSETVERVLGGTVEYAVLLDASQKLKPFIDRVIEQGDAKHPKGQAPDDREWLIERLIEKYEHLTEVKATVSTNAITNRISGRFFNFVRLVIPHSMFADQTLGKVIKAGIKARRSS
ncbi:hypothetical protein [Paraburkholderia caffeinilytica]|uniref:hypothetical protein n=1 Tax=Paraburkholderia caffeinilytica TaxID=1761016 RepID=UPI0038B976B5